MSRVDVFYLVAALVVVLVALLVVVARIWRPRTWLRYWLYVALLGVVVILGALAITLVLNVWVAIVFVTFALPGVGVRAVQYRRRPRPTMDLTSRGR